MSAIVTKDSMNYASVAFVGFMLICVFSMWYRAKKLCRILERQVCRRGNRPDVMLGVTEATKLLVNQLKVRLYIAPISSIISNAISRESIQIPTSVVIHGGTTRSCPWRRGRVFPGGTRGEFREFRSSSVFGVTMPQS